METCFKFANAGALVVWPLALKSALQVPMTRSPIIGPGVNFKLKRVDKVGVWVGPVAKQTYYLQPCLRVRVTASGSIGRLPVPMRHLQVQVGPAGSAHWQAGTVTLSPF